MSSHDDPRDTSKEVKETLPRQWTVDAADALSSSGMFISGLVMVTKNRFIAWPNVIFALSAVVNSHPLRSKEGGSSWQAVSFAIIALSAAYAPVFLLPATPKPV